MGKVNEALPPFLAKLILLTQETEEKVAKWNADGAVYIIVDDEQFNSVLKKFFKGTTQTFVRQLHFYGFKKIDVDSTVGAWGFEHENGLFIKDNIELVKNIKRKTKIDPDSQKLASYYEVEALKSQVSFLQQIIEDLRDSVTQLRSNSTGSGVNPVKAEIVKTEPKKELFQKTILSEDVSNNRKRPRTTIKAEAPTGSFMELCSNVLPPSLSRTSSFCSVGSLGSFAEMDFDHDFDNFTGIFNEMELEPLPSIDSPKEVEEPVKLTANFEDAIDSISQATKVNKNDVSKIINFLSQLSLKDEKPDKKKSSFFGCQELEHLVPMNVRKVGVGAS